MSARLIVVAVALAACANAFGGQLHGRDSMYATGASALPSHEISAGLVKSGRDSVYVGMLPSPPHKVIGEIPIRHGRT